MSSKPTPPVGPSISVVVGTYNGEKFVLEQLKSILSQSLPPSEIVVSDDNSGDATIAIVEKFASQSRIPTTILKRSKNIGFGENFLQACARAKSDIIAFSDQDDIWLADKLAICLPKFSDPEVVLVVHSARLINQHGDDIGRFSQFIDKDDYIEPLSDDPWGGHFGFSMLFRKSLLKLLPIENFRFDLQGSENKAHDNWISILARSAGRISQINQDLVLYRQHGNNVYGAPSKHILMKDRKILASRARDRARSALLISDMMKTIRSETYLDLPLFSRTQAVNWWLNIHKVQDSRARLFGAASRWSALILWFRNLFAGVYSKPRGTSLDVKTALKDFGLIIFGKWH